MQLIRIALVQTHWPGHRRVMVDAYRDLVHQAADGGAELVCLPEFTLSPYFASSLDPAGFQWAEPLPGGPSDRFFRELAVNHGVMLVGSIFERAPTGEHFDTATLYSTAGELVGYTRKVHIPGGLGYHEDRFFGGGDQYPVHDGGKVRISMPSCYDQWFPEVSRICALNGAELIVYPTAIGSEPAEPEMDSMEAWQTVMRGQAVANQVYIAATNRIGREGVAFYGSSFVCDPAGRVIAQASRDRSEVIWADLDPELLARWRSTFQLFRCRRPETYGRITETVGTEGPW